MPTTRRVPVPVASYAPPAYPTRRDADPALLVRYVPPRWRRNPVLLVLLTGTAPAVGCREPAAGVAPVAEHGDGIGSYGCEVMVPPVFLSEAEAVQAVRDELAVAGVTGLAEGEVFRDVKVAPIPWDECEWRFGDPEWKDPFEADFYGARSEFAIEVLTEADHEDLATEDSGLPWELVCESSVDEVDLLGLARALSGGLREAGAGRWYGVLYDPVVYMDEYEYSMCWYKADDPETCQSDLEASAKDESRALLRAQVTDLLAWMEEQGLL